MVRFLEDIQFKDFSHAASLHSQEDQSKKDIPGLIESKFKIKPELLDIKGFQVLRLDVMSTGDRAKALCNVQVKLLNSERDVKELEMVFFFKLQNGEWFMDLQSSL